VVSQKVLHSNTHLQAISIVNMKNVAFAFSNNSVWGATRRHWLHHARMTVLSSFQKNVL